MNNQSKNNNVSDELLYEFVMDEMEQGSESIKGLWAKALAHSEGNDSKAKSLYMQYRVQAIKDQLSALEIDLGDLSREELFESIKNGFTVIPEKIQIIKEQKAEAKVKATEIAIEKEVKKENEKYSKFGGWLIVLAVFLVFGNIFTFLTVERFFENENLDTLKYLYQNELYRKASLLETIAYIGFVSYGLLLAFTISFFRKHTSTKNLAIIYFGSNVIAFPIMVYLLIEIDLPTISIMTGVVGGVMQTFVALMWIRYFMVSERVRKTFVHGDDEDSHSITIIGIGLGVIFLSVLYANQVKDILSDVETAAILKTTSEAPAAVDAAAPAERSMIPWGGNDDENAVEAFKLGERYSNGSVTQDLSKAREWFTKACNGGNSVGCDRLGNMYNYAEGVERDYFKAVELYAKSCDSGYAGGCRDLAQMYFFGRGVKEDYAKSDELLDKACVGEDNYCRSFK